MPDTDGAWATTRFVDPDDLAHDMHVNIVTFQPGGSIPFAETHVMEHGLFVLEGKGVYRLNGDWVEVEAGDFMWLRAFCPQACYAGGPGPFRYLLYKDVNRQVRLTGPDRRASREPMGSASERMPVRARSRHPDRSISWSAASGCSSTASSSPAEVGVRDGVIARIAPLGIGTRRRSRTVELADDEVLIPGLVDTHVHVNEPGRTEWEGFASATRAAAAGGVTTIVDMPLNSIPPTTIGRRARREACARPRAQVFVDVGFWGGVVPGNAADLVPLVAEGVFGFKCFLVHSGVDEFPPVTRRRDGGGDVGARRGRRLAAHRARRGRGAHRRGAAPAQPRRTPTSSRRGRARPRTPRSPRSSSEPQRTGARAHILHLSAPTRSTASPPRSATACASPSRPARTT